MIQATGKDHTNGVSMVLMRRVWQKLQETDVPLTPECPSIRSVYHREDWGIPYTPICPDCGLPYYHEGKWVGLKGENE